MTGGCGGLRLGRALLPQWREWGWADVLIPLFATRMALLVVGRLSLYFPISPDYPIAEIRARGWNFSSYRLLDIWGRWDSNWYMDLALHGYSLRGELAEVQSNVSFFPLYPYLVRALLWLVPDVWQTRGAVLVAGVTISNLALLAALLLLHRLLMEVYQDRSLAQRTVLYVLLYPTAFFLSAFYTESTFLLLAVATFYAGRRRAWGWAALAAGLIALTRVQGFLMIVPLAWMYMDAAGWRLRAIRADALWLLLTPLGFFAHLAHLHQLTGDWLAFVHVQQAWSRDPAWPWQTLLTPVYPNLLMTQLERILTVVCLAGGVVALFRLPSAAYGLYTLMVVLPPLFTGTLTSTSRFYAVLFPVMILLAAAGRRRSVDAAIQALSFATQIVLMVAWSQFYWVA